MLACSPGPHRVLAIFISHRQFWVTSRGCFIFIDCSSVTAPHQQSRGANITGRQSLFLLIVRSSPQCDRGLIGGFVFGSFVSELPAISNAAFALVPIAVFAGSTVVVNLILILAPPVMIRALFAERRRTRHSSATDSTTRSFHSLHSIHARALIGWIIGGLLVTARPVVWPRCLYWHCHGVACSSFFRPFRFFFLLNLGGSDVEQDPGPETTTCRCNDRSGASAGTSRTNARNHPPAPEVRRRAEPARTFRT